jgi:hypothetical protein
VDDTGTRGVLYVAAGAKYIRAAVRSAESIRTHCPGLSTHLYADWESHGFDFRASPYPFSSVASIEHPHRRSKVDYLARTPFDRTLYLDTDTALNADVGGMFEILDRFDIALCHAHLRHTEARLRPWRSSLPNAFPEYNSGVMLFRRTPAVLAFLEDWRRHYHAAGFPEDQVTLRELLWLSGLRIATLPPEYNVRFFKYHLLWSGAEASTQIFHLRRLHDGRLWLLRKWVRRLGRPLVRMGIDPRKWLPTSGK